MQPDGLGALNLAFEQLKEKLFNEGVCSEDIKKALPRYPEKIGVVTSDIGAAVEDIKNITARRYPLAEIVIVPTVVQGDKAASDIVKSIELLDNRKDIDVIIVGRGGGSLEDLWAFNTEEVARAVIACNTPIVSAVGHETDTTICDFVSDLRAPTPSAAAEIVCPDINVLAKDVSVFKTGLRDAADNIINSNMQLVLDLAQSPVLENYEMLLQSYNETIDVLKERLADSVLSLNENKMFRLSALAGRLNALSPLAVLARGYSVAQKEKQIVKSISQIKKNDKITLVLQNGKAECIIDEVIKNG